MVEARKVRSSPFLTAFGIAPLDRIPRAPANPQHSERAIRSRVIEREPWRAARGAVALPRLRVEGLEARSLRADHGATDLAG